MPEEVMTPADLKNVSELEGAELDAAVAKAAGYPLDSDGDRLDERESGGAPSKFNPSTNWLHGGQIIERERITLQCHPSGWVAYVDTEWSTGSDELPQGWKGEGEGQTPLIAAMRAFAASRLD